MFCGKLVVVVGMLVRLEGTLVVMLIACGVFLLLGAAPGETRPRPAPFPSVAFAPASYRPGTLSAGAAAAADPAAPDAPPAPQTESQGG